MKKNFTARTDFASERITNKIKQDSFELETKDYNGVETQMIRVLKDKNPLSSKKGTYISLSFEHLNDSEIRDHVTEVMVEKLHFMIGQQTKSFDRVLVVGLGNSMVVADALGPKVCEKVMVTSHLFEQENVQMEEGIRSVSCITPGVMGQTGIESSDIIFGVCEMIQPSLLIVVDALATKSMARINKMIQLSDTGIEPGSGVGNIRKAIDYETLKIPVIVIGVATVVDVISIARAAIEISMEQESKKIDEQHIEQVMEELLQEETMQLIVTPKQMDEDLVHLSEVIATAVNTAMHKQFDKM